MVFPRFLFTCDLLVFFIAYELMISLVFFVMYLTANSRGAVEAILFFLGWAIVGSILVGSGLIYIIMVVQSRIFFIIYQFCFSPDELYYLYILLGGGFGTKLSLWPFWYWLPRAHVEVSTSTSIFLSCILIKVCFYGLIRIFLLLGGEVPVTPFIFFISWGVLDLITRLVIQVDLKAITAYSSVLHVNLLVL